MARKGDKESVEVEGRAVRFTHPDKVLYQATGTTKSAVLEYYTAVAPLLVEYAGARPVTRKRWPDGTHDKSFFEKNLPQHTPDWVPSVEIEHSSRTVRYPVLGGAGTKAGKGASTEPGKESGEGSATLAWFAQQAALELHVPQWRLAKGAPGRTRRIVIDLDPGPEVDLDTTAQVALRVRDLLAEAGLAAYPVTSGSKGIHLYAPLDKPVSAKGATALAKEIAKSLEKQTPDLVTATMKRSIRSGKVFVDWSQNNGAKTTVAPYSLRGRAEPWVAAPRSWEELGDGGLSHLHWDEVLKRLDADGDLLAGLETAGGADRQGSATPRTRTSARAKRSGKGKSGSSSSSSDDDPERHPDPPPRGPTDASVADASTADASPTDASSTDTSLADASPTDADAVVTSLDEYRRKRDQRRTPEPFAGEIDRSDAEGPVFVIQEHHARRLHYDFRLEHQGVLVSWAVPKNLPTEPRDRRLAVHTEDHPLGYETFSGRIPRGEYGAGTVAVWDHGTYDCEKWDDDEVVVWLSGSRVSGRYVLVRTNAEKNQWIVQYMLDQSRSGDGGDSSSSTGAASPSPPLPMIPTAGTVSTLPAEKWAFEGKWDGYRVTVATDGTRSRMVSRNGNDMTWLAGEFPGLAAALETPAVLDGELVVPGPDGVPDFASLAKQAAAEGGDASIGPVHLYVFDILELDRVGLQSEGWERRREVLDLLAPRLREVERVHVPDVLDGPGDRALAQAEDAGWEGVVAKRRDSRYEAGRRSRSWIKEKLLTTTDAVVGGWRPGKGGRSGSLGSLLLGVPAETGLTYIGRVGTGFTDKQGQALLDELASLKRRTSPFVEELPSDARRDATWVLPKLVVEVRHQGFTDDGVMRQPNWRDIRRDKLPGDV